MLRLNCLGVAEQVCSEYHYLLLFADKLVALNQVSGKVVDEVTWGLGSSHSSSIVGKIQGIPHAFNGMNMLLLQLEFALLKAFLRSLMWAANIFHVKVWTAACGCWVLNAMPLAVPGTCASVHLTVVQVSSA